MKFKEDDGPGYAWVNEDKSLEVRLHEGAYWMLVNNKGEIITTDDSFEEFEKKVGFTVELT